MKITSARFLKSVVNDEGIPKDSLKSIAFIGRSNVGKSSLINTLIGQKLARSSSQPGHTKEVNFYLINNKIYFIDLPGYGFAKGSKKDREILLNRIFWYLEKDIPNQKIILIIDAIAGMTTNDQEIFNYLKDLEKEIIVVLNKIDKLNKSELDQNIVKIKELVAPYLLAPVSTKKQTGIKNLLQNILQDINSYLY